MITQYEVPSYLTQELPAFNFRPQLLPLSMNIYKELQHFTEYTRQAIEGHNYGLVKRCFQLANKLYEQGDTHVRSSIENIYIFSFSSIFPRDKVQKAILRSLIPDRLHALYINQIYQRGC